MLRARYPHCVAIVKSGLLTHPGKELWKAQLPASGNATPMTYRPGRSGKQYVVVAAGGAPKITEESLGDVLVAFTLPD